MDKKIIYFKCNICDHNYISLNDKNMKCPYCIKMFCNNFSCLICLKKNFGIHIRSKY
jgi:hypothetical protein